MPNILWEGIRQTLTIPPRTWQTWHSRLLELGEKQDMNQDQITEYNTLLHKLFVMVK